MRRRQRQREFVREIPSHCCVSCTGILYPADPTCLDCGETRPPSGWLALKNQSDPWLGRVMDGRYLITRALGAGGSGRVYRAYATSIQRDFALKFVTLSRNAGEVRERVQREVDVMGKLKNPHVVPFYEVFELPGHLVIVMDFVSGRSLQAVCEAEAPLAPRRVMKLSLQVANALHEAHRKGLVHRDIKPDNLMVETLPSGDEFVHVLDFGIVREQNSQLTRGYIGTPMFTSPEQALGQSVDGRSDVYSLGCAMFYALTKVFPFEAPTVMGVLQAHVELPRPTLGTHRQNLPSALEGLVGRMMARHAADRPQSMLDVVHALGRLLEEPQERQTGDSPSDVLTQSRSQIKAEVDKSRQTMRLFGEQLAEADASSFSTGVEFPHSGRLFAAYGKTPIVVRGQDVLEVVGQAARTAVRTQADMLCITHSGGHWLTAHASGELQADGVAQLRTTAPMTAVAGSMNGGLWVAGSEGGRVYVANGARPKPEWQIVGRGPGVTHLAVDRSGTLIAVARETREIEVLRNTGREEVCRLTGMGQVRSLAFSRDGYLLAVLCDRAVAIYETMTGRRMVAMRTAPIEMVWFETHGLVGYGWKDNALWGWNLERSLA